MPGGAGESNTGIAPKNIPPNFIEFYEPKNKFQRWVQRLEGAFSIYSVTDTTSKNSYFLHYIGADLYDTLCDLVSPTTPERRTYEANVLTLTNHQDPTPLEISEYYKFHHRLQKEGEPIKDYIAALRKLASTCNFGSFLSTALRNQLVCGIRSQRIKDRLLEVRDLTLEKAIDIAAGMESAQAEGTYTQEVQAIAVRKKTTFGNKTNVTTGQIICFRCGSNHNVEEGEPGGYSKPYRNYGVTHVTATIGRESLEVKLYIISGNQHPLLGRDWIYLFNAFKGFRDSLTQVNQVSSGNSLHALSLQKLFEKYSDLFDNKNVGEIKGEPAALHLKPNAKPAFFRARPVPFALKDRVEQEIDNLARDGVLVKVDYSEFATPIVPVVKPNGKIRICGDYKLTLNQNLLVDEHPLPTSEELFNGLAGGDKFTKIDLRNAYLNWKVREEDQHLLTLNTHKGLYKCTRLVFGLNCAPAKWQRKIESILREIPGVHCFIDDIRIPALNDAEHLDRLDKVFARLAEFGLKVNLEKSEFMQNEIEYCGYKISREGVHKVNSKVKAVVEALNPTNVSELQALLGLVNYYGRFLYNLSSILEPLPKLLRKGTPWYWSAECDKALLTIKKQMLSDTVLAHYSPDLPLILATDASPTGVGAVLSHIMPDGTERPIHFASQTLNSSQRKWAQIDKEAYGIVFGVKRFFQYLYGRKFILHTDHKPLVQIFSPTKALPHLSAARMQHYAIFLQGFQYDIKYKNSKDNANADALSRLPITEESGELEGWDTFQIGMISVLPITVKDIAAATKVDKALAPLLAGIASGKKVPPAYRYGIEQNEFSFLEDCLMRGTRVVVPTSLRNIVLKDLHSCHFGANRMLALARSYCWWPGMDKDIKNLAKNCLECSLHLNSPPEVPSKHTWERPSQPFERIHIDFAGKFENVYFLLIIDAFSKWPEVHILNKIDTESTIEVLDKVFTTFGYPRILTSDNGTQFVNPKFNEYLKMHAIIHKRSAPYHPATNGQVERYVQTLKNKLRCLKTSKRTMQAKVNEILFQYRITPHSTTGKSPAEMIFTYQPTSRFSLCCPSKSIVLPQTELKVVNERNLLPGTRVVARNYIGEGKWKLGTIEKVLGTSNYLIKLDNGNVWRRHIDQIRQVGNDIPIINDNVDNFDVPIVNDNVDNFDHPNSDSIPNTTVMPEPNDTNNSQSEKLLQSDNVAPIDEDITIQAPSESLDIPSKTSLRRSKRIRKPVVRLNL
ncbi:hypothetical protein evm_014177 [Chilo suppressalis]|nr:hypothetical protein evm_014177 [Chilo suppressalis]